MKYVSANDYLMGRAVMNELSPTQIANINTLIPKVNELLERFGEYRKVNSGLRTMADHTRIYKEINAKRKAQGLPEKPVPMGSHHLSGAAIDLEDRDDKLKKWILNNVSVLDELDIYCESFSHTDTWVHIQCISPKTKKRFFIP
jgi:hypothetical protein